MWFLSAIAVAAELWGFTNFEVLPLLVEPSHQLDATMDKKLSFLESGHAIATSWPHGKVRPIGLSCDSASDTVLASTQFGMFTAQFSEGSAKEHLDFKAAPLCDHVQGESLQDVTLRCSSAGSVRTCSADVLHSNGQRIATCALDGAASNATAAVPPVTRIAEEWLRDSSATGKASETAIALAMTSECHGKALSCAYVGTSGHRIVEMQRAADGSHEWFPSRLLRARMSPTSLLSSGTMDVVGGRYLSVLNRNGQHVEFLDLRREGSIVGSYQLPQDQAWGAMCAAKSSLYFLSKGPSPQLWRFPVPPHIGIEEASQKEQVQARDEIAPLLGEQGHGSKMRRTVQRWK
jgi:hypothetical protein